MQLEHVNVCAQGYSEAAPAYVSVFHVCGVFHAGV